uniref:Bardet-Biedl syndrome 5 protein homolog n=1 Tax=Rhabditophanes sp. KR3021 TaxID=114890 RepID=A0AC35UH17_9BILA
MGFPGVLRITNIRLIWHALTMTRINLSIGFNNVHGVTTRAALSKVRGRSESLYLMAKNENTRFEFIFTCVNASQTRLFTTVIGIHRAYETSKMYRELKMRGSLISDNRLKLLPSEICIEEYDAVWNLSSDQGNLGMMIVTNVRVVWFASLNPDYNVSIPFLQLQNCKIRDSKFGLALVLESSIQSGDYILGFRMDPHERLHEVSKMIQAMHQSFISQPIFGVHYNKERQETPPPEVVVPLIDEDIEIDEKVNRTDAYAAYFPEGVTKDIEPKPPVFSEELGMAIEQLKPGFTVSSLWNVNVDL